MCRVFGCVASEPVSIRRELLEAENPLIRQSEEHDSGWGMAVYERAINERVRQYAELKRAVAGILYMRNKIEGEIRERRAELARLHTDIARAVGKRDDEVALVLITQKDSLLQDLERWPSGQRSGNTISPVDFLRHQWTVCGGQAPNDLFADFKGYFQLCLENGGY